MKRSVDELNGCTAGRGTGVPPVSASLCGTGVPPVADSEDAHGRDAHATDHGRDAHATAHGRDAHATANATSAQPTTVVLITHHVEELPPATSDILILSEGRLVAEGAPAQVLTEANLSRAYKCPVHVRRSNGRFYAEVNPRAWEGLIR